MKIFNYTIKDELGIHARPAGLLVKTAKDTGCTIIIEKDGKQADVSRLFAIMSLGVKCGDNIVVKCEGENEEEAALKMNEFFKNNL